jgi:hypothetical protein
MEKELGTTGLRFLEEELGTTGLRFLEKYSASGNVQVI